MSLPVVPVRRPASLNGALNGRLSASILTLVPGQAGGAGVRLCAPAARSWRALCAAALDDGHVLKVATHGRSYRPYVEQETIFRARYTPHSLWAPRRRKWQGAWWSKKPGVAAAAVPGTSNHGWGLAVDCGEESDGDGGTESLDAGTLEWLIARAGRLGWSWEIQSEPWHLRYFAGDHVPLAVLAFENGAPPNYKKQPDEDEEDMLHIRHDTEKNWYWSIDPGAARQVKEINDPAALELEGVRIQRSASMRYLMKHHWGVDSFKGQAI